MSHFSHDSSRFSRLQVSLITSSRVEKEKEREKGGGRDRESINSEGNAQQLSHDNIVPQKKPATDIIPAAAATTTTRFSPAFPLLLPLLPLLPRV